ncbi:MAG: hypothetical protein ACE5OQ_15345 [Woeseia sp.]
MPPAKSNPGQWPVSRWTGTAIVIVGMLAIGFTFMWASPVLALFSDNTIGSILELIVPFLPVLLIMIGALLITRA